MSSNVMPTAGFKESSHSGVWDDPYTKNNIPIICFAYINCLLQTTHNCLHRKVHSMIFVVLCTPYPKWYSHFPMWRTNPTQESMNMLHGTWCVRNAEHRTFSYIERYTLWFLWCCRYNTQSGFHLQYWFCIRHRTMQIKWSSISRFKIAFHPFDNVKMLRSETLHHARARLY